MEKDVEEKFVHITNALEHTAEAVKCINQSVGSLLQICAELRTDVDKLIENQKGGI